MLKLTHTSLSLGFQASENHSVFADHDMRQCLRMHAYVLRLKATKAIAEVCYELQRCEWTDEDRRYTFILEWEGPSQATRVIKGVKHHWMEGDHSRICEEVLRGSDLCIPGNLVDYIEDVEWPYD
jgi:hypothetical protein